MNFDFLDNIVESLTSKILGKKQQPSYSNQLNDRNSAVTQALQRQEQVKQQASQYLTDPNNVDERGAIQRELSNMDLNNAYRQKGINALIQNRDVPPTPQPTVKPAPFVNQAMAQQPQVTGVQDGKQQVINMYNELSQKYPSVNPLDLDTTLALSYAESKFDPAALGQGTPDTGLFQISPGTRDDIANRLLGMGEIGTKHPEINLKDPRVNYMMFLLNGAAKDAIGINRDSELTPAQYYQWVHNAGGWNDLQGRITPGGDVYERYPKAFGKDSRKIKIPKEFVEYAKSVIKPE